MSRVLRALSLTSSLRFFFVAFRISTLRERGREGEKGKGDVSVTTEGEV